MLRKSSIGNARTTSTFRSLTSRARGIGRVAVGSASLCCLLAGCTASNGVEQVVSNGRTTPMLDGVSTSHVSVGEQFLIHGRNFPQTTEGWVDVTFRGKYIMDSATTGETAGAPQGGAQDTRDVDLTIPFRPSADNSGTIVWEHFGGYRIPFQSAGERPRLGYFEGEIFATNRYFNETPEEDKSGNPGVRQPQNTWQRFQVRVGPSLVINEFRAFADQWVADCREPAMVTMNRLPYAMRVEAVGFQPMSIRYSLPPGLLKNDGTTSKEPTNMRHHFSAQEHVLLMGFGQVPQYTTGYRMSVSVEAEDINGGKHNLFHSFVVREPIQIFFDQEVVKTEVLPAVPMDACTPGTETGFDSEWNETWTTKVERGTQITDTRNWTEKYGREHTSSYGALDETMQAVSTTGNVVITNAFNEGEEDTSTLTDSFNTAQGRANANTWNLVRNTGGTYTWNGSQDTDTKTTLTFGQNGSLTTSGQKGPNFAQTGEQGSLGDSFSGQSITETETNTSRGGSTINTTNNAKGGSNSTNSSENRTEGLNRAAGAHWAFTNTYAEANGFVVTNETNRENHWDEASAKSAEIAREVSRASTTLFTRSSEQSTSVSRGSKLYSGRYGVWYRQATRLTRFGTIVAYDACGNGTEIGRASIDDWVWTGWLNIKDSCEAAETQKYRTETSDGLPEPKCFYPGAGVCSGDQLSPGSIPVQGTNRGLE